MLDARMIAWCGSQVPGVVVTFSADAWHVLCPAGTTFDAAEALRLELVARTPAGVAVDVQIAPAPPGALSAEDEAGVRLFGELRAERLGGGALATLRDRLQVVADENAARLGMPGPTVTIEPVRLPWTLDVTPRIVPDASVEPAPSDDDEPFPWDEPEGGAS